MKKDKSMVDFLDSSKRKPFEDYSDNIFYTEYEGWSCCKKCGEALKLGEKSCSICHTDFNWKKKYRGTYKKTYKTIDELITELNTIKDRKLGCKIRIKFFVANNEEKNHDL